MPILSKARICSPLGATPVNISNDMAPKHRRCSLILAHCLLIDHHRLGPLPLQISFLSGFCHRQPSPFLPITIFNSHSCRTSLHSLGTHKTANLPINSNPEMALTIHLFSLNTFTLPTKSQTRTTLRSTALFAGRRKTQILCNHSDADLASDLASEVAKINTHLGQREEAMKKSRELLFVELCRFLALDKEDVKKKWNKLDGEQKWVLVKEFVNDWSANFHPLSARSVKEMIEEYLHDDKLTTPASELFPGLKKIMGLS